jgi:uncharacterized protein (TIGR00730 family)
LLKRVSVFCGSRSGTDPRYRDAATALARELLQRRLGLVFGGGSVGLMGVVADAVLDGGGEAIGVIPHGLAAREVAHRGLADLRVVSSMHARKALMADLSDAFVALPGGFGTFEELFEVVTWAQLGIHRKPIGLLNVAGYYDHLVRFLDHAVGEGFVSPENRGLVRIEDRPGALLDQLAAWRPLAGPKWITPEEA